MEKQEFLVSKCKDKALVNAAKVLAKRGIKNVDKYYIEEANIPFFEIMVPFKKESKDDPDFAVIFLDVEHKGKDVEYTVYTAHTHEHFDSIEKAADLICGLINKKIVEVVLVFPDRMACVYTTHTGDHEKNINIINDNAEFVMQRLASDVCNTPNSGHIHEYFAPAYPYTLRYTNNSEQPKWASVYLVSQIIGEHPEVYIIEK